MHHLPEFWPDPEEFNPERFLNDAQQNYFVDAFAPFCDGVHKCVGYRMALSEISIIVSMLLHQFRFELVSPLKNLEFTQGSTLIPKSKIMISVMEI